MAKKPMTRAHMEAYFAKNLEPAGNTVAATIDEKAPLEVSGAKRLGPLPFHGSGNWSWSRERFVWDVIQLPVQGLRFLPRQ